MPKNAQADTKKELPFEEAMAEIDNIVTKMDAKELSLADSVALFEQGSRLIKNCQETLKKAEQTVTTLMQEEMLDDDSA